MDGVVFTLNEWTVVTITSIKGRGVRRTFLQYCTLDGGGGGRRHRLP